MMLRILFVCLLLVGCGSRPYELFVLDKAETVGLETALEVFTDNFIEESEWSRVNYFDKFSNYEKMGYVKSIALYDVEVRNPDSIRFRYVAAYKVDVVMMVKDADGIVDKSQIMTYGIELLYDSKIDEFLLNGEFSN